MEIITGLWLAQAKQLENIDWCKSKKIQCAMNFYKYLFINRVILKTTSMDFMSKMVYISILNTTNHINNK